LKNFLFSTTALAVAGAFVFGADANAAAKPIKIAVGGFMTSEMGFGDNDSAFEDQGDGNPATGDQRADFNNVQDSELLFTGSSKLDNGVTVSINIQIETDRTSSGQNIDETYMKLTGSFGDLRLGSTTGSNSVLKHVAPAVGQHPRLGGSDNYVSVPAAVGASNSTDFASSGDNNKIAYISPRAGGLAVGVSFTPSTANAATAPVSGGNASDQTQVIEGAVSFETTMGTSSVKADVGLSSRNNNSRSYRAGVNVGFGGVTFGGSIAKRTDNDDERKSAAGSVEAMAYDLGLTYAMGSYTFGITKAYGEQTDGAVTQDEQSKWAAGISYAIDTGVSTTLTYTKASYNDGALGDNTTNNDGHALVGQIKVSF
jgi:hypothetical protein